MKFSSTNQALLLCGGLGTRLKPLTDNIPKCLVPIKGIPLLELWLEMLTRNGFSKIIVNTHHHRAMVSDYIKQSPWCNLVTLADEAELLGTGGTLKENASAFNHEQPILLAHGDNLTKFNIQGFLQAHKTRPAQAAMTMLSFVTDVPQSCGILECDENNLVQRFHEKKPNPPGNIANAAVYLLSKEVLETVTAFEGKFIDFSTQVIPQYIGRILSYLNDEYHRDIGTLTSWNLAQKEFPPQALPPKRHEKFSEYFSKSWPTDFDQFYKRLLVR